MMVSRPDTNNLSPDVPDCGIQQVSFTVTDIPLFLEGIRSLSTSYSSHIICFNASMMAGRAHVISALLHARRAFITGTNVSGSFEIEALLYASGSRQCQDATKFGIHQGLNHAYLCLCPWSDSLWNYLAKEMIVSSDDWEGIDYEKKSRLMFLFSISNEELMVTGDSRLQDLVLERVALLDVNK